MVVFGLASFVIGFVNILAIYILIGLLFNLFFSFLWLLDLYFLKRKKLQKNKTIFALYTTISIVLVFSMPLYFLILRFT